jgi:hypothetical protein
MACLAVVESLDGSERDQIRAFESIGSLT